MLEAHGSREAHKIDFDIRNVRVRLLIIRGSSFLSGSRFVVCTTRPEREKEREIETKHSSTWCGAEKRTN